MEVPIKAKGKTMKKRIHFITAALFIGTLVLLAMPSYAQKAGAGQKAEAIAQQLNLTPQQKVQILPILRQEVPKVNAIKNDNSISRMQKLQQIKAIHQQTDPQMKSILTPAQYEKLKTLRQQAISDAMQTQGRYR
jgi:Spy/CpxP family protein refolding chaperone